MGIVLEEADEAAFWIELLTAANKTTASQSAALLHEANELVAIVTSSIKTARRNAEEN
jgi:four helix bundle protein